MAVSHSRWLAFACLVLLSVPAIANEVTWPRMLSTRLELQSDRAITGTAQDSLFPFVMHGQLRLNERLTAMVEGSLLFARTTSAFGAVTSGHEFSNLTMGLSLTRMLDPTTAFSIGFAIAMPSGPTSLVQPRKAASMRRIGVEAHHFFPQATFALVPITMEAHLGPHTRFRTHLRPVIWIPSSALPSEPMSLSIEHWDELSTELGFGLLAGLRFQAVMFLGEKVTRNELLTLQTSAFPFLGFEPAARGGYGRFGFLVPLTGEDEVTQLDSVITFQMQAGLVF